MGNEDPDVNRARRVEPPQILQAPPSRPGLASVLGQLTLSLLSADLKVEFLPRRRWESSIAMLALAVLLVSVVQAIDPAGGLSATFVLVAASMVLVVEQGMHGKDSKAVPMLFVLGLACCVCSVLGIVVLGVWQSFEEIRIERVLELREAVQVSETLVVCLMLLASRHKIEQVDRRMRSREAGERLARVTQRPIQRVLPEQAQAEPPAPALQQELVDSSTPRLVDELAPREGEAERAGQPQRVEADQEARH